MAVDFSRFSNTDFNTTPFQYIIFGKNGGLLEVELNEAQYLGFIRDSIALKNIGNRCSNATITRVQNGNTTLKGDFILNGYAIHSVDTSFTTKVNDNIYAKVSLETLDKDSKVTKNGVVGGVSIDNTILDNRVQIETSKRKAIRLEINTTGGEGFVKIAYVHSKKRAVLTLDTIDLSDRFLSTIESLRYSGYLNAFDGDFTDGYYETDSGKPVPSNTVGEYHSVMTTNFIPCEPFEKIKLKHSGTLKRDSSSTFLVLFYDSDKNFLPNKCVGSGSSDTSYTFNVPSGAYYFRFNVASDNPVMSIDVVEDVTVIRHYSSQVLPNGTVVSSNADFAEVAMWSDKNPDNEDRLGYFVSVSKTEDGITITKATSTSGVRGVTISHPAFSANASDDKFENEELKKEYDYVAFAGFGTVIDNGTCTVNGRCMPDDNGCAVPSNNSMGYQVIERVDDTHVLILVEPNADMLNHIKTDIDELNINKVDKEDGKGLFSGSYNDLSNKPLIPSKTSELENDSDFATNKSVAQEVAKIVAGAPEEFDTLKEMSDWLTQHEDSAAAMNSAISDNKTDIETLQTGKADASDLTTHTGDTQNPHSVTKAQVGLENVDNTSDMDKPVSTAQQEKFDELKDNLVQLELSDIAGGKNLVNVNVSNKTYKGVKFTVNEDKSISVSGTSNGPIEFLLNSKCFDGSNWLPNGDYYISDKLTNTKLSLVLNITDTNGTYKMTVSRKSFTIDDNNKAGGIYIYISPNTTVSETIYPQIEIGTTETEYEPYIPSVKMIAEEVDNINDSLSVIGKCKNLLNPTLQTTTLNGVTCTDNGDGTYTLNGTATQNTDFSFFYNLEKYQHLKNGTVKLVGCPKGGSSTTYGLYLQLQKSPWTGGPDIGEGLSITINSDDNWECWIRIYKDVTVSNLVFKPMITTDLSATYDDFVPYTGDGETLTHDVASLKQDLTNTYLTKEIANNTYATTGQISGLDNKITNLGTQLNTLGQNVGQLSGQVGGLSEECSNVKSSVDALKNYTVNKKAIGEFNGCVLYRQVWTGIVSAVADEIINHEIGSETWGADGYITKISAYGFKQMNGIVSIKDFTNSLTFSTNTVTIHNTDEIQYNYTLIIEYAIKE